MVGASFSYFSCFALSAACRAATSRCLGANSVRSDSCTALACGDSCSRREALTTPILISACAGNTANAPTSNPAIDTIQERFTVLLPKIRQPLQGAAG